MCGSFLDMKSIQSSRLQLEKHLQQTIQWRCYVIAFFFFLVAKLLLHKSTSTEAAISKIPKQIILSEVRRMVEEVQTLNKQLEKTEADIEEYFKPIDKEAEYIMTIQLDGEEKTTKQMMKAMQEQTLLEKAEAERVAIGHKIDDSQTSHDQASTSNPKEAEIIAKMQLEVEEKAMKELMKSGLQQALREK